jgi:putative hydrolase of the HAD superfamily
VTLDIQAIAFDVNGTLVEIITDENMDEIYRAAGHFLTYQGIDIRRTVVRELYFKYLKRQKKRSTEEHPEFDAVAIWRKILKKRSSDFTYNLPQEKLEQMPTFLAEQFRGISRRRHRLFPHVKDVLDTLRSRYPLAIVTDAQSAYARPELHRLGLLDYFNPIVVSGDHGFRKPDIRLFHMATHGMGVAPENTLFVGDSLHRDIQGAQRAGLKATLFDPNGSKKHNGDVRPDHIINDMSKLLKVLDVH